MHTIDSDMLEAVIGGAAKLSADDLQTAQYNACAAGAQHFQNSLERLDRGRKYMYAGNKWYDGCVASIPRIGHD